MVTETFLPRASSLKTHSPYERPSAAPADEELARRVQHGHTADLAALVQRHHSPLLGFLYRLTGGDRSLAEDLAQEAFLRALRSIRQYQSSRRFKPWLYAIAVNVARDHFKRADTRYVVALTDEEFTSLADPIELDESIAAERHRV